MIIYTPLWETLKKKKVSTYALINKHRISSNTIQRIRRNMSMNTVTLNDLCRILDCEVGDVLCYVKDDENNEDDE